MTRPKKNINPLDAIAEKIRGFQRQTLSSTLSIGELLEQAANETRHGEYEEWVKTNFAWSLRSADRYRNLFKFSVYSARYLPRDASVIDFATLPITMTAAYHLSAMFGPMDTDFTPLTAPEKYELSVLKGIMKRLESGLSVNVDYVKKTINAAKPTDENRSDQEEQTGDDDHQDEGDTGQAKQPDDGTPESAIRNGVAILAAQIHLVTQWAVALEGYDAGRLRAVIDSLNDVCSKLELRHKAKSAADRAELKARLH